MVADTHHTMRETNDRDMRQRDSEEGKYEWDVMATSPYAVLNNLYRPIVQIDASPAFVEMRDQHQATSHLLDPRVSEELATGTHTMPGNNERDTRPTQQGPPSPFLGYDDGDVRALKGAGSGRSSERTQSNAALWRGNPWYSLTSDLLGVVLSFCFLSTFHPID